MWLSRHMAPDGNRLGGSRMKTVTIHCEHASADIHLRISESNLCYIQCGLIQIFLSDKQAAKVRSYCQCMLSKLQYARQDIQVRTYMTVDPSQIDLGGDSIGPWLIG
jgi:hypothetical protein